VQVTQLVRDRAGMALRSVLAQMCIPPCIAKPLTWRKGLQDPGGSKFQSSGTWSPERTNGSGCQGAPKPEHLPKAHAWQLGQDLQTGCRVRGWHRRQAGPGSRGSRWKKMGVRSQAGQGGLGGVLSHKTDYRLQLCRSLICTSSLRKPSSQFSNKETKGLHICRTPLPPASKQPTKIHTLVSFSKVNHWSSPHRPSHTEVRRLGLGAGPWS
jgi:Ni/Co efflux regulator RcnB